jgi:hypothetical protein
VSQSVLIPGSIWHYPRCLSCGSTFMPEPPACPCGGSILPGGEPAPETNAPDWLMILERT